MPICNAQALLALPHDQMVEVIRRWTRKKMTETQSWNFWARDDQAAPPEDWRIWLVMAGRGYGKTRMGAEWVRALAARHAGARFALVGVFVAQTAGGARVAITGAGNGVFRHAGMEAALTKSFTPEAVAGVAVDSTDLNADLHASKAYRAHLITVQTQRAVKQANG